MKVQPRAVVEEELERVPDAAAGDVGRVEVEPDGPSRPACDLHLGRVAKMVDDRVLPVASGARITRDPRHRVGDVAVEAGKEPEAVLAGKVRTSARAGVRDTHAARL